MLVPVHNLWQFCAVYHLGRASVRRMLKTGQLQGIRTGAGWRIPDPGPVLVERVRQQCLALEDVPFVRGSEVAQLMGITPRRVRQLAEAGILPCRMRSHRRVYALADVIAVIKRRQEIREPGTYIRSWVLEWAKERVAEALQPKPARRRSLFL